MSFLRTTVLESEEFVIGFMLLRDEAFGRCAAKLTEEDFADDAFRYTFGLLKQLQRDGDGLVRMSAIGPKLIKEKGKEGAAKVSRAVVEYQHLPNFIQHLDYHMRKVIEASQRRKVEQMGKACLAASSSEETNYRELIQSLSTAILDRSVGTADNVFVGEMVNNTLDEIERSKTASRLISFGIASIDEMVGGLAPGEALTVAGMVGGGKTSFAVHMAMHAAKIGKSVGYFSLEMSRDDLIKRMIASVAGIDLASLFTGRFTADERKRMVEATNRISQWRIAIFDKCKRLTVDALRDIAASHKKEHGLDMFIVDNLQLMTPQNKKDPREQQVSEFARECKLVAGELQVCGVSLAQLNREATKAEKGPRKEHLRESGGIEQHSDHIFLLFPRSPSDSEKLTAEWHPTMLRVGKQRRGPEVDIPVIWNKRYQQWDDLRYEVKEWQF